MGNNSGESGGKLSLVIDTLYQLNILKVKNLSVARDMVKSLAVEAQASREANGLLIMQKGEGRSLEKIK